MNCGPPTIFIQQMRPADSETALMRPADQFEFETPGLVVRAEDSRTHNQEDVGSNPDTVSWMDISVASYYVESKIIKEAKWGTP